MAVEVVVGAALTSEDISVLAVDILQNNKKKISSRTQAYTHQHTEENEVNINRRIYYSQHEARK